MEKEEKVQVPISFSIFKFVVTAAWYIGWLFLGLTVFILILNTVTEEKHSIFGGQFEIPLWVLYQPNNNLTPFINHEYDDIKFLGHKTLLIDFRTKSAWVLKTIYHGLWAGAILWIAFNLRMLIRNIRIGKPFTEGIVLRFKRIGLFFILLGPFYTLIQMIMFGDLIKIIQNRVNEGIIQTPVGQELDLNLDIILIGIVIIIISYIFQIGAQLQQDQELTI